MPLHAWLPRAHPEAPSPVSALMSAAMVNLGVYGIIRFDLQVLGPGPRWWGLALLVIGGASAMYGVLQATVATDLKRLLAYSTTENMGLVTVALGAATLFADSGAHAPATIAMAAAMLHLVAHAAFKSLGFLGAGSVLAATGLRDLDRLGGLARKMPATTILFGVAALGASGLPLGAGFVSEWLLIQSLIHAASTHDTLVALTAPVAVGAVALTTGLGVAAMVKAFGIGFLARPRSAPAAEAREAPGAMLAGMTIAAAACVVMAVAPMVVAPALRRVLDGLPAANLVGFADFGVVVRLPGVSGSIAPGLIAAALVIAVLAAVAADAVAFARAPATGRAAAVGMRCRRPDRADAIHGHVIRRAAAAGVRRRIASRHRYRGHPSRRIAIHGRGHHLSGQDRRRDRGPALHPDNPGGGRGRGLIRRAHTGSVHLYLAYGALGVLIMLVVAR